MQGQTKLNVPLTTAVSSGKFMWISSLCVDMMKTVLHDAMAHCSECDLYDWSWNCLQRDLRLCKCDERDHRLSGLSMSSSVR